MNLRTTQQLVKLILQNYDKFDGWSLQGFGMLRLYMPDHGLRMSIWDMAYRVPNVSIIHTHPWSFDSLVVAGRMYNHRFEEWTSAHPATHWKQRIYAGEGGGLRDEPERVALIACKLDVICPGHSYKQDSTEIHASYPIDGTVTLCDRIVVDPTDPHHADVYWALGTEWVSAEPFKPDMQTVKNITEKALALL